MSIQPTVIRDITMQRWSWNGKFFINRDRTWHDDKLPLFVPDADVLRFSNEDWWDWGPGQVQNSYHAAVKFTSLRLKALAIHHRLFVCAGCGQWAGDCSANNDSTKCLCCSGSKDEWRDGDRLRDEPLPSAPDCEVQA